MTEPKAECRREMVQVALNGRVFNDCSFYWCRTHKQPTEICQLEKAEATHLARK